MPVSVFKGLQPKGQLKLKSSIQGEQTGRPLGNLSTSLQERVSQRISVKPISKTPVLLITSIKQRAVHRLINKKESLIIVICTPVDLNRILIMNSSYSDQAQYLQSGGITGWT
jgi:hypothetical protein